MEDGKTNRVGWRERCLSRRMGRKAGVLVLENHLPPFHLSKCELLLLPASHFPLFPLALPPSSTALHFPLFLPPNTNVAGKGWSVRIDLGEKSCISFLFPSLLMHYNEKRKAHKYLTFPPTINVAFSKIKVLSIYKGYLERDWKESYLFKFLLLGISYQKTSLAVLTLVPRMNLG